MNFNKKYKSSISLAKAHSGAAILVLLLAGLIAISMGASGRLIIEWVLGMTGIVVVSQALTYLAYMEIREGNVFVYRNELCWQYIIPIEAIRKITSPRDSGRFTKVRIWYSDQHNPAKQACLRIPPVQFDQITWAQLLTDLKYLNPHVSIPSSAEHQTQEVINP